MADDEVEVAVCTSLS